MLNVVRENIIGGSLVTLERMRTSDLLKLQGPSSLDFLQMWQPPGLYPELQVLTGRAIRRRQNSDALAHIQGGLVWMHGQGRLLGGVTLSLGLKSDNLPCREQNE